MQQALTTLMTTLRRHAPGHAQLIETALTDVSEFHQATFTAASPEAEVTATVNARGELVSLDV
ncbi:MAG: hypothetical protein L0G99_17335, partial [Propionibacteriales bacterium]|nr:hypothetical protein [Propionibacteriales bacterium]